MEIGEAEVRMFLEREQEQEVFLTELEGTMEMGKVRMSLKREQEMFLAELEGRMEMGEAELNMAALSLTAEQEKDEDGDKENRGEKVAAEESEVEKWDLGFGNLSVADSSLQRAKLRTSGEVCTNVVDNVDFNGRSSCC